MAKSANWMLYALRLKWELGTYQEKREKVTENEMAGTRKEIQKGETDKNTAIPLGKLELGKLKIVVHFCEFHMRVHLRAGP